MGGDTRTHHGGRKGVVLISQSKQRKKVNLSMQKYMEAYGVERCRGQHKDSTFKKKKKKRKKSVLKLCETRVHEPGTV
jgi:hypothetical protein